jgi:hypothetical protein
MEHLGIKCACNLRVYVDNINWILEKLSANVWTSYMFHGRLEGLAPVRSAIIIRVA